MIKKFLNMSISDDCTTTWMYLRPTNWRCEMFKTKSTVMCLSAQL
jgi:hypothetical protein